MTQWQQHCPLSSYHFLRSVRPARSTLPLNSSIGVWRAGTDISAGMHVDQQVFIETRTRRISAEISIYLHHRQHVAPTFPARVGEYCGWIDASRAAARSCSRNTLLQRTTMYFLTISPCPGQNPVPFVLALGANFEGWFKKVQHLQPILRRFFG